MRRYVTPPPDIDPSLPLSDSHFHPSPQAVYKLLYFDGDGNSFLSIPASMFNLPTLA
jgi:hypothetical protein